ncbi:MAG: hypothetical protein CMB03_04895 [Euryarchaeota archaeon]|nr:hypothetical protein [Euryarchaeota archaeon]MBE57727.1 hypothetical protein [Euryarchaeota archaeon]MCH2641691.1 hypothetical protein [Candidatus Thalassarchaeum sp.]|tara:strand:+ start:6189 stop:6560 length:372 start_codon:yes stop_codon:yes gene_type:complete
METEEEDLVVTLSTEESSSGRLRNILGVVRLIWTELTAGVGAWGSLKPLVAGVLAAVPFFFLGQHFNRQHQKGFDWMLLQLPLALTIILLPVLWAWSIIDAYRVAMVAVSDAENRRRALELVN